MTAIYVHIPTVHEAELISFTLLCGFLLGLFNSETVFGPVSFNRFNQNTGRATVSWQVTGENLSETVLPIEVASATLRYPSPSWQVRIGCPAGSYAAGEAVANACLACQEPCF